MTMAKSRVEVFTTGCAGCAPAVALVEKMAGPECEVIVRDLREDADAAAQAVQNAIRQVPAVVVDGRVAPCCEDAQGPTREGLTAAGVGSCS
ncbi:thioredoxin family protein [Saccharopolyspora sp. SCSIO 74807]|uniref:thioredoxin family protein n=1 Tax=Saccharopolyspora sp. SCSIO 74807 TaxID=3118084 RepID=UPI0030D53BA9